MKKGTPIDLDNDSRLEVDYDFTRRSRAKIPEGVKEGGKYSHRHVRKENVEHMQDRGWEIETRAKSNLTGLVLMRIPTQVVQRREAEREYENRLNAASVQPEEQAARLSASHNADVHVPRDADLKIR